MVAVEMGSSSPKGAKSVTFSAATDSASSVAALAKVASHADCEVTLSLSSRTLYTPARRVMVTAVLPRISTLSTWSDV